MSRSLSIARKRCEHHAGHYFFALRSFDKVGIVHAKEYGLVDEVLGDMDDLRVIKETQRKISPVGFQLPGKVDKS